MKEKQFIELLNLYIDGEATPEEISMVEAGLRQSAKYRRIYNEYRQMQHAYMLLAEREKNHALACEQATESSTAPTVSLWKRLCYPFAFAWGGTMMAITCVALVFLMQSRYNSNSFDENVAMKAVQNEDLAVLINGARDPMNFAANLSTSGANNANMLWASMSNKSMAAKQAPEAVELHLNGVSVQEWNKLQKDINRLGEMHLDTGSEEFSAFQISH